jgi:hypothetical protein
VGRADGCPVGELDRQDDGVDFEKRFPNPIACLLTVAYHVTAQILSSGIATVSNLVLTIYLVRRSGVKGAIAATVVSNAASACIPVYTDANSLIRKLSHAV